MKNILLILSPCFLSSIALAVGTGIIEMDEADLAKKASEDTAVFRDEQPLRVQEHLVPPIRTLNLRAVQSQVLNLNMSEKELEETEPPVEE